MTGNKSFDTGNNLNHYSVSHIQYVEREEEEYYGSYDQEISNVIEEADDQDQYYSEEEYDYDSESLIKLILGVQTYLSEQAKIYGRNIADSPLYALQYKMYNYLRQRALELGADI
ncbi:hypothetical protein BY458DRAFT_504213 [Sporodiniella umbellata]|nr:hypothetical protein BY458DRAFT_504213 [Sporodiniella umbellata]